MKRLSLVLAMASLLCGCEAAFLTVGGAGAGVAMGTGVEKTMSGVTYKTYAAPMGNVRTAALTTLKRLDMKVTSDQANDGGWEITALASGRHIDVQLERLTAKTTRMRVAVAQDDTIFFKDASTATEISLQTADALDERPKTRQSASR